MSVCSVGKEEPHKSVCSRQRRSQWLLVLTITPALVAAVTAAQQALRVTARQGRKGKERKGKERKEGFTQLYLPRQVPRRAALLGMQRIPVTKSGTQ